MSDVATDWIAMILNGGIAAVLASTTKTSASTGGGKAASFFLVMWVVIAAGAAMHLAVDRHRHGHRQGRAVELALLSVMVFGGAWAIWAGILHASGQSGQLARSIGYAPSMFQWEVGWADIAIGVLGVGCAWRALRAQWMTAAVVVLTISYGGDAIGHLMQWVANDNTAPDNVWALPSDILQPVAAIFLLVLYRRSSATEPTASAAPAVDEANSVPTSRQPSEVAAV